jgi:hypothetical protein
LNIRNHNNKIIVPKEPKLKNIQKEIRKPITPKCQLRWDTFHEQKFNWITIWYTLKRLNVSKALSSSNGNVCIKLSIQNIDYKKWKNQMVNVIFVKNEIESLMHLFYRCHIIKHVLDELKHIFNIHFWKEYSSCWGKLNPWGVWGRNNRRPTYSESGNLYIKMSNLESKKLYKI